ncbi:2-methylcitrate dehydratase PrpD [Geothermobacter ehrlichii]|uniref:2-methylcitrate dehydratase PrpD n=1 Tax=Geothermobacter ehrlichii TaxID=213224 RepID=A0A5D3WED7_9BACT|nr:MmgE/PrpD family protein [Geothermobacter ehrlichii]TYO95266.1 2-methylcitrate dehydratase PrpD [Geothermobacter ehrlichii]
MSAQVDKPTQILAEFLAELKFEDLPVEVVSRTEDLFLDWFGSALAGKKARQIQILEQFAETMGPADGASEIFVSRRRSSPYFAALVNAASSHYAEQDDVHNGSVFHPGTVVFPAVVAAAQQLGSSGRDVIVAAVAGYEAGIRIGESLGCSHYKIFHTTGTAGTLAAAAGVARLLAVDGERMLHALGSAGTQAAGLWEFLRDAADSKQLHTAKAAADGLLSAYIARDGFVGAQRIIEGEQGMAAGMSKDADPNMLVDRLGTRWAIGETSFKFHASCRHTHPAADALLELMSKYKIRADEIDEVLARVHRGAIDVLGPVTDPQTVHQAKFSMGFVLAMIALKGRAGIEEFNETALRDPAIRSFSQKVKMILDDEVDRAYPKRWLGRVEVVTRDGRRLKMQIDTPKGDPGNTLSRGELEDKAIRLAMFQGGATREEMQDVIARVWRLRDEPNLKNFLMKT